MFFKVIFLSIFAIGLVQGYNGFKNTTECQAIKEAAMAEHKDCTFEVISFDVVIEEIVEASIRGKVAVIVKKYCDKLKKLRSCLVALTPEERKCLDLPTNSVLANLKSNEALEYLCANDGSKIVSFVKEGGVQCWRKKETKINKCTSEVVGPNKKETDPCKIRELVAACMVNNLKECPSQVPAQIVEAFFNDVPCDSKSYV